MDTLKFSGVNGKFQTLLQSYHRGRFQSVLIATINAYGIFFVDGKYF